MTADELKARRIALGLSQAELARALGVDVTTISRWERGARTIPPYLALALDALTTTIGGKPMQDENEKTSSIYGSPDAIKRLGEGLTILRRLCDLLGVQKPDDAPAALEALIARSRPE